MSGYIKANKNKHKYVIGIDFGHGQTSADICPILWDESSEEIRFNPPQSIQFGGKLYAIPSLITIPTINGEIQKDSEHIKIGKTAIEEYAKAKDNARPESSLKIKLEAYFKKRPSEMSKYDKDVMKLFMGKVYASIRYRCSELTDDNHIVCIACPSDTKHWTAKEQRDYADIALSAGIPIGILYEGEIGIIRESRAAFLKTRHSAEHKAAMKNGILVIDCGSSTVDLTYYARSRMEIPIDGGDNTGKCGGKMVEELIFKHLTNDLSPKFKSMMSSDKQEEHKKLKTALCDCLDSSKSLSESIKKSILLTIRNAKETYYDGEEKQKGIQLEFDKSKLTAGLRSGTTSNYCIEKQELNIVISEFISNMQKCFNDFKAKNIKDQPVLSVILTGGVANMDPIKQLAIKTFSGAAISNDKTPELTISNGIADAARVDLRASALLYKLLTHEKVNNNTDFCNIVFDIFAKGISQETINKIDSCYIRLSSGTNSSIYDLECDIKKEFKTINLPDNFAKAYRVNLCYETNQSVLPDLQKIVGDYFPGAEIKEISSERAFACDINISPTTNELISESLEQVKEFIAFWIIKGVYNFAAGVLSFASAVIEKSWRFVGSKFTDKIRNRDFDDIFNENFDALEIPYNDKFTDLWWGKRQIIYQKYKNNRSSYKEDIKQNIKDILKESPDLKKAVDEAFKTEVKKYIKEQVTEVRLIFTDR